MTDKEVLAFVEDILYNESETEVIDKIKSVADPKILHIFADNHNWDDGFAISQAVLDNENCDLGTALLIFYRADGFSFLLPLDLQENAPSPLWLDFIKPLYDRIVNNEFKKTSIEYTPDLTKVQKYKIRKLNGNIPPFVLEGTGKLC